MRIARLGVVIDSSGAKTGASEVNTAITSTASTAQRASRVRAEAEKAATAVAIQQKAATEAQVKTMIQAQQATTKVVEAYKQLTAAESLALMMGKNTTIAQAQAILSHKSSASQARVTAAEIQRAAQAFDEMTKKEKANAEASRTVVEATKQVTDSTRAMTLAHAEALRMDEARGKSMVTTEAGLNRLRPAITSLAAHATGANGAVGVLTGTIGSLALGNALTIGILAGIAAISTAYTVLTAETRKQEEATRDATEALKRLHDEQRRGETGALPEQLASARKELERLRDLEKFGRGQNTGGNVYDNSGVLELFKAKMDPRKVQQQYKALEADIAAGEAALVRAMAEGNRKASSERSSALADLVASNRATIAQQTEARNRLRNLEADLAQMQRAGVDMGNTDQRAKLASLVTDIQTLSAAFISAAKPGKDALRDLEEQNKKTAASLSASQKVTRTALLEYLEALKPVLAAHVALRDSIEESIVSREKDNANIKAQVQALLESKEAYERILVVQAQEKAVAEARAKLPAGQLLEPGQEDRIKKAVAESSELQKLLADMLKTFGAAGPSITAQTNDWATALQSVSAGLRDVSGALSGAGSDAVKTLALIAGAIQRIVEAQKQAKAAGNQKATLASMASGYAGIAFSSFAAGSAIGGQTTNKVNGALGGAGMGALQGAAMGSVIPGIGTAVGAIVGGLIGGLGGLISAGQKAKGVAAQLEIAQNQLGKSLDAMRAVFAGDELAASISKARAEFDELRKQTEQAYSGKKNEAERKKVLMELNVLEAQRVEMLKTQYAEQLRQAMDDLQVQYLRAKGLEEQADATALASSQATRLNAAIEKYGADSAYVNKLKEVIAAEKEAAENAKALAEATRQRALADNERSLRVRELTVAGDTRGAFVAQQEDAYADAIEEAQRMVEAGTMTAEMFERLKKVLGEEMAAALADFDNAVALATERQRDELSVRRLLAMGMTAEAEQRRIEIANKEELRNITDEAIREEILELQAMEAANRERERIAAEAQRVADQLLDIDRRMLETLKIVNPEKAAELEQKLKEAERQQELANAANDVVRARLLELYALQDQADALTKVTAELERQKRAAEELARFTKSIDSQWLRAMGRTFDADLQDLKDWRDEQLKSAEALGATAETLTKIQDIFDKKYTDLIASTMQATEEVIQKIETPSSPLRSFGDAPTILGDRTVVNSGSSPFATDAHAAQFIDVSLAQLSVLREILGALQQSRGPSPDLIDAIPTARRADVMNGSTIRRASLLTRGEFR